MDIAVQEKIDFWLQSSIDTSDKKLIQELIDQNNNSELTDAFYKDLEFGTGGLRGIMGLGSNRINKYTIGAATQGLSNYLKIAFPNEQISVAVAYDCRNNSSFFADTVASVFSANGITVHLFKELRPTPQLSFAIRKLKCKSGVVLTASHNPREYNGYKAYWDDGAQIVAPHDTNIINEVRGITDFSQINFDKNESLIHYLGDEMDEAYLKEAQAQSLSPECIANQKDISIVFSSIHGTGITLVPKILENLGFTNVNIIEEQATPNGDFPTVVYPNPEEEEALTYAIKKAQSINADLVMATDPDADRVGIAVQNLTGEFLLLNGNQTGALIVYYLCKKWQENNKLNGNQYVVNTIVTTNLINDIAAHFNIDCYETLTGFKHIASVIRELDGKAEFIGGGEESYGYMIGDFVRDKDAVTSCAILAEMTAWAKDNGKSLYQILGEIYQQFGLYYESLVAITKKGKDGSEAIKQMMVDFRKNPPKNLGSSKVSKIMDYQSSEEIDVNTGSIKKIDLPQSNVLQFFTEEGSKISVRPSGTEPKIKFYFSLKKSDPKIAVLDEEINELVEKTNSIKEELNIN
jgi:phosphoglucomutase